MTTEAVTKYPDSEVHINSLATARSSGEVIQLPDGRAGVFLGLNGGAVGDAGAFAVEGVFKVQKTASVVMLNGQEAWWVTGTNKAHNSVGGNFFLGTVVEDAAAADTTVLVDINKKRVSNAIDLSGGFDVATTQTSGTPTVNARGGTIELALTTTAEAQMASALSEKSVAVNGDWIAEFEVDFADNGDDAALDINIGLANAGHASDADSITEAIFVHLDGNTLDLDAESDDGTTEVGATDTTVDVVEGTYALVQIDGRDPSDCQIYVNGALVLSGSTFNISAATGPLKFLAHIEKSSNDTPGQVRVRNARVYLSPTA